MTIDVGDFEYMATTVGDKEPDPYKTLRLTLAMRGGVSLAVWIGGVVAELDLFRRACTHADDSTEESPKCLVHPNEPVDRQTRAIKYQKLLGQAGFTGVEIDILTGASAGGLNAILFGLAQASRTVLDETVRETWIMKGGIWELLRPSVKDIKSLFRRRVTSILQGDDRLYGVALEALQTLNDPSSDSGSPLHYAHPRGPQYNISIELAATLLDDIYSPGRGNRAGFSFRKTAGSLTTGYTTIPSASEQAANASAVTDASASNPAEDALACMALAARSTSSFPGAFEPAQLHSAAFETNGTGLMVNMARAFPHARSAPTTAADRPQVASKEFDVVDGGIFDNIPIDRAIRAIRRAPSALPSERRLIYIDPEPPAAPTLDLRVDPGARRSWLPVINSSKALQKRTETASDELGLLRQHNDAVLRTQGRLEALASAMEQPGSLRSLISPQAYVQYRIGVDSNRFGDLLTDPWAELCQPPRLADDYEALSAEQAANIKTEVARAYNDVLPLAITRWEESWAESGEPRTWTLSCDLHALLDQIRLLISWVRELERLIPYYAANSAETGLAPTLSSLGSWKKRLYRYLTVITEAKHRVVDQVLAEPLKASASLAQRRAYVPESGAAPPPNSTTLAANIVESQRQQMELRLPADVCAVLRESAGLDDSDGLLYEKLAEWLPGNAGGPLLYDVLRTDLNDLLSAIRAGSRQLATTMQRFGADVKWVRRWQESVYPHFYVGALADSDLADLASIFALTGTPDTAALVVYEEITSDLPPGSDLPVERLRKAARAKYLQEWLRHEPTQEQVNAVVEDERSVMNADAKLAGNELSRFGGFFLARWRENDWQWGRLDAAAGIVGILTDAAGSEASTHVNELQAKILEGANATLAHEEDNNLPLRVGAETLDSIHPHYRFALASRAVPLVLRALLPAAHWSPASMVQRFGILVLRMTFGVMVPLVADPLRGAMAVVVIVSAAGLLGGGDAHRYWVFLLPILLVVIVVRTARVEWRWYRLRKRMTCCPHNSQNAAGTTDPWKTMYAEARSGVGGARSWRTASWILAVAAVVLSVSLLRGDASLPRIGPPDACVRTPDGESVAKMPIATLLLLLLGVAGLHMWFIKRAYRIRARVELQPGPSFLRRLCTGGARSAEASRILRVFMSIVVLIVAGVCGWLSSLVADNQCLSIIAGVVSFEPPLMPAGMAQWPGSGLVVAAAVILLALNSLWGWAQDWAAILLAGLAGGVGWCGQLALENADIADRFAIFDLLPMVVWLVVLGLFVHYVPSRALESKRRFAWSTTVDRNTRYGEKCRPVITAPTPSTRPTDSTVSDSRGSLSSSAVQI